MPTPFSNACGLGLSNIEHLTFVAGITIFPNTHCPLIYIPDEPPELYELPPDEPPLEPPLELLFPLLLVPPWFVPDGISPFAICSSTSLAALALISCISSSVKVGICFSNSSVI